MKLFHSPGSCSLGIRILLEQIGCPYTVEVTDLKQGAQRSASYLALNPKGKVPALLLPNGDVLTEFPVIAYWLARRFPDAALLPKALEQEVRVMELTEHIVSGLHMRGSVFAMMPQKFTSDPTVQTELRQHGQGVVTDGFDRLTRQLGDGPYLFDGFTIADAAAYYLLSWHDRIGVELPAALQAYVDRLSQRPSIVASLA
ncbi:glutathione S-transferase family protein [Celeribacter baekdonensis]|uniref:Glutathione S-transferase n=1 Tax=Celeribacter baekdonensis TaxID=875171 RepID=A0A2R4LY75_9RHOB|nr:glutathione S-transferase family protein [Celeribacter baekdonensis]AVW89880.1 glutathione S-transferase [Celeribacter baekdonensis]